MFDSGYASWLEEGRQDLIMFSFFLDVARILIPSYSVFRNNTTIDFKAESSMKLLLSHAVTIAARSQVSFVSEGKNPFAVSAVVQAFNFQACSRGGKIPHIHIFENDSPSDAVQTDRAGMPLPALAPKKQLLPSSAQLLVGVNARPPCVTAA